MKNEAHSDDTNFDKFLAHALVGKSIVRTKDYGANEGLVLSDGTELLISPNMGCGGCNSGNYSIDSITHVENVIMSARMTIDEETIDQYDSDDIYTIFVYTAGIPAEQKLAEISGTVGNGWYGGGFELIVNRIDPND